MMQHKTNLAETAFERAYGDITAIGAWFGPKREPSLFLIPTGKIGHAPFGWKLCAIPQSHAWAWSTSVGDPAYAARASANFAASMGFTVDQARVMHITGIIQDCLGDLLKIPPKPTENIVVADVIRTDERGRAHHDEVIERV